MKLMLSILLMLSIVGCSSVSTSHRPDSYYVDKPQEENSSDLFGTGELLSDTEIERILSYKLTLPPQNRVAILKLSNDSYWRYYSNDFTELNDSLTNNLVQALVASPKIYDASFLPSMLVPEKRTVPYLREAAARYQADLLLVYRSKCSSYQKYRFLAANETKAYCSVEAALLDVRKGIVPFTSVATNAVLLAKKADDTNFNETRKKAELEAVAASLGEVAAALVVFIAEM